MEGIFSPTEKSVSSGMFLQISMQSASDLWFLQSPCKVGPLLQMEWQLGLYPYL